LPELTLACRLAVLADTDLPRPVIPKDNHDYFSQLEIESFKTFVKKMDMEGTKFEMAPCESRKVGFNAYFYPTLFSTAGSSKLFSSARIKPSKRK
jgi:hypothetical protein